MRWLCDVVVCLLKVCFFYSLCKEQGLHKIARLLIPVCNHTEIYYIIIYGCDYKGCDYKGCDIKGVM